MSGLTAWRRWPTAIARLPGFPSSTRVDRVLRAHLESTTDVERPTPDALDYRRRRWAGVTRGYVCCTNEGESRANPKNARMIEKFARIRENTSGGGGGDHEVSDNVAKCHNERYRTITRERFLCWGARREHPGNMLPALITDYGIGRGHAMALFHVLENGTEISEKHVGSSGVHRDESTTLRIDGLANR